MQVTVDYLSIQLMWISIQHHCYFYGSTYIDEVDKLVFRVWEISVTVVQSNHCNSHTV